MSDQNITEQPDRVARGSSSVNGSAPEQSGGSETGADYLTRSAPESVFPPIVCLCGSTRFVENFNEWRQRLTYEGKIVLSIEIVTTQARDADPQHVNLNLKAMLDELHLRKIDISTEVMVLNVGGYIGESTRREIQYATSTGKPIKYLEAENAPSATGASDSVAPDAGGSGAQARNDQAEL